MKKLFLFLLFFLGFYLIFQNSPVYAGHLGCPDPPQRFCEDTRVVEEWNDCSHNFVEDCVWFGETCSGGSCVAAPQPTPTPTPPPSKVIDIRATRVSIPTLISANDTAEVDLYVRSGNGETFIATGSWGIDFRVASGANPYDYFTSPSPQQWQSLVVGTGWQRVGRFSTGVKNSSSQCLTDIAGQIVVNPVYVPGDASIRDPFSDSGNVINIGGMIGVLHARRRTDDSQGAAGASITISSSGGNCYYEERGTNFTADGFGQVFGVHRMNCSCDFTIRADWNGWSGSKFLPRQTSGNPDSGGVCNGRSIGHLDVDLYPPSEPTPTPTPTSPSGCGTPPGGASWRWKDASVGYACTTNLNACNPADACVGTPYQCQGTNWVQLNAGECTTACFGFCSGGPAPTPTPTPTPAQPPGCTAISLSSSPGSVAPGANITFNAASDYGYTNVGVNGGGGTVGGDIGFSCCAPPNPPYEWSWTYKTTTAPGTYTATFSGDKSGVGTCRAFANYTVQSSCPSSAPTGLAPNTTNSFTPTTSTVTLSWNAVAGATSYHLRLEDGLLGNDPNVNGQVADNCTADPNTDICINNWGSTSINITVVPGRKYNWLVAAVAASCPTFTSPWASFSVFQGYHDGNGGNSDLANCRADGWAYDPDGGQATVRVYRAGGGGPVASGVANQYRPDLDSANVCEQPNNNLNGNCSFNINLDGGPPGLIPYNSDQTITVRAVDVQNPGTEITLNTTPKTLNCGDASPWWQTRLGDVRSGGGSLTDRIPSSCVGACTPLLSLTNNSAGLVTYKTPPTADFGSGSASTPNWKVDNQFSGSTYSYDYVTARVAQTGTATVAFDGNNPPTTSGVYTAASDATIAASGSNWQVPAGAKITVLVGGNLTINRVIKVAPGGFLAIYAKGNISVSPSLGTSHNNDSDNQLEGLYVADGSFLTGQTTVCNPGNNRLNVGGTIVVDADLNGSGTLSQQRCLGPRDGLYPSFYVNYRPDFLLNAPSYIQRAGLFWQEIAP